MIQFVCSSSKAKLCLLNELVIKYSWLKTGDVRLNYADDTDTSLRKCDSERVAKNVIVRIVALMNSIKVTIHVSSITNCRVRPFTSYTSGLKYCISERNEEKDGRCCQRIQ